jgi:threonine dehydrogenase-like Zn-dependent dehydrogenase
VVAVVPEWREICPCRRVVEEVGGAVRSVRPGQFVVGSFAASDNTCPNCRYGYQWSCQHREFLTRAQAPALRVPLADGTRADVGPTRETLSATAARLT